MRTFAYTAVSGEIMRSLIAPSFVPFAFACVVAASACGIQVDLDAANAAARSGGALDGAAILRFVNSEAATVDVLDDDVGIDARAARYLVAHVWGDDERFGTADDDHCDSLDELDSLSYVGDTALRALDAYVRALAPVAPSGIDVAVEGVLFTAAEAASALSHCNERTEQQLDDDVGL